MEVFYYIQLDERSQAGFVNVQHLREDLGEHCDPILEQLESNFFVHGDPYVTITEDYLKKHGIPHFKQGKFIIVSDRTIKIYTDFFRSDMKRPKKDSKLLAAVAALLISAVLYGFMRHSCSSLLVEVVKGNEQPTGIAKVVCPFVSVRLPQ